MTNKNTIAQLDPEKAPYHTRNLWHWMAYFLSPYKKIAIAYAILRPIRSTFISMGPLFVGFMIQSLENGTAQSEENLFLSLIVIFGIMFFLCMIIDIFTPEVRAYSKAARNLALFGIDHLSKLSLNWHENQGSGKKIQRVMNARTGFTELTGFIRWDIIPLLGDVGAIIASFYIMDIPSHFAPYYAGLIISYISLSWYFSRPFNKLYTRYHEKVENLMSGVYEFVSSIKTVKAFNLRPYIQNKAIALEQDNLTAFVDAIQANLFRWTLASVSAALWLALFAYSGFKAVTEGEMTTGAYAATFFLAYRIWFSCENIGTIIDKFYEHSSSIQRFIDTMREPIELMDKTPINSLNKDWKNIKFNHVSYHYPDGKGKGLNGISFDIKRGEKVAFVGPSGAGKSTLTKLILKQVIADNGSITVDDSKLSHIPSDEWLNEIAYVPQDIELFNLTLRENIAINKTITDKQLEETIKQSALDEFIDSLPNGLDTIIGERGVKLSGGQRQRLGIARALIRKAPIMLFDEATSALDSISESKIQKAMENSFADRTIFIIAHRLSTIKHVDKIIVLDEGKIIEQGTFNELNKKKSGAFAQMWSIQSNH